MAQISKGDTFADGQQLTAARLNQLVDSAQLSAGAITDQTNITANTVASGDSILLYDLSATALREANVSDVLGSNLPVATSAVTAGANSDIVLTPNDGTIVTGKAYTSGDGLTVTVISTAHGLVVGQVILITAAGTGYNGTFRVATVATDSFTYVMTTAATAGGGSLSYTKKGSVRNAGSESVAGSLFVAGTAVISGATAVSGATTLNGATTVSGALTSNGTANFTGAVQYSGTPVYSLSSITETAIPFGGCDATSAGTLASTCNQWVTVATIPSLTKTNKEIWRIYATTPCVVYVPAGRAKVRLVQTSTGTVLARADIGASGATGWQYYYLQFCLEATIAESTVFTGDSIKFEIRYNAGSVTAGAIMQVAASAYFTEGFTSNATITKYIKP